MKGKMAAQLFFGPGDVRYLNTDIPKVADGEILVKIKSALTCGTDLKTYKRGHPTVINQGSVFGHEYAGDIVETGRGVEGFKVGDRVVALNSCPCFRCYYCKLEEYSMCENIVYNNGAYAQYITVPPDIVKVNTFLIPDQISYREAALLEPLSCVVHGIDEINIRPGDTVAINGTGPIGLMFVTLARLKGAKIIATDLSDERLYYAQKFGADHIINASRTDQVSAVKEITEKGYGADVAIEATGFPDVWEKTILMGRKGAVILLFGGWEPGSSINIDTKLLHYSELDIKGVYHHTPYYARKAFNLLASKKINAKDFITSDMPLKNLIDALEMVENRKGLKYNIIN